MSFWSRLFGGGARGDDGEAVLATLVDACRARDAARFAAACEAHLPQLGGWFPAWMAGVEGDTDPAARRAALLAVARWLAEERGDRSLLTAHFAPPTRDGVADLAAAEGAVAAGRPEEAIERLVATVARPGLSPDGQLAVHLRLGPLLVAAGRLAEAESAFTEVASRAERLDRLDEATAAREELFELARWRGDGATAAVHADRAAALARRAGQRERAAHWSRRSTWARQGEPPARAVVVTADGTWLAPEEAGWPLPAGSRLVLARPRELLPQAVLPMAQAERFAEDGAAAEALEAWRRAAALDPLAPEPVYRAGLLAMDQEDHVRAGVAFAEVERLAPGWYGVRAAEWLRAAIVEGRATPRAWHVHRACERRAEPDAALADAAAALLARQALPPLQLDLGLVLERLGRPEEARRAYDAGLEGRSDPGTRTALLLRAAAVRGPAEGHELLGQALALAGAPLEVGEARARWASWYGGG